ncbi:MAG: GNAT family N-acetyltransferase [Ruminococcus sp.]
MIFSKKVFSAVGIPYSPKDRHADVANVESHYMNNGCFWCPIDDNDVIGTIAIRKIDDAKRIVELKRMFVLPEFQGNGYGRLLLEHAVKCAREQKYQKICLDTRKQFSVAQLSISKCRVSETERYNDNEHAELYFEMDL